MAYAAVASVSETIDIVLKYHKESISPDFEDLIRSIQKHSVFFRSFLEEFSERAKNWDETIREVTDQAEEIIELLLSDLLTVETTTSGGSGSGSVHYSLGDLERVSKEMESMRNRIKGKHIEASGGGDEELMEIIAKLREGSPSIEVIAIVGMAGMGKAALAKKVYDHPLIVKHFEVRAWSTISQDYNKKRTIVELLRCMKLVEPVDSIVSVSEYDMIESLYNNLFVRRYLIVLDDIWKIEAWDRLKRYFPDNGNGSRIIVTTRLSHLCQEAGASYIHEIRLLDEDQAWIVVRKNVFRGDPCPPQLALVGKKIAGSCGGHPLCIQVVSGIVAAADHTVAAWEDISQSININTDEVEDEDVDMRFLNVLSLSYTYLPHHLRPCFLYLASFPEDEEIRVSKLIKLWVAEGFLNETESESCEDVGEERVEDLVRRGLASVTETKSNGTTIKSVEVHHLMRELCLRQARTENFNYVVSGRYYVDATELLWSRRVTTCIHDHKEDMFEGVYGPRTRTIILSSHTITIRWSIANLRLLRILDLVNGYPHDVGDQVFFHLFHLRYLAFRCRSRIPEAISNLKNLQTLIIFPIENYGGQLMSFDDLGDGIWRMPQLRHLFTYRLVLPLPAAQIGGAMPAPLEDLQTLSVLVNFICLRDNLKTIPNLRKLGLFYMSTEVVLEDFELHNLVCLHKLQILKIEFDTPFQQHHNVRCAFKFPPSLKKLHLYGLGIFWEDMNKIVASLPNLEVLKLKEHACMGDTWETSEGGFSQLIYLLIEKSNLENWITETSHFSRLKHLVLRRCLSLFEVPGNIGMIPTLELIELDEENQSLLSSAYQIQEDRQCSGDYRLQIRVV